MLKEERGELTRWYIDWLAHGKEAELNVIGAAVVQRLVSEVRAALRRRPRHEAKLAGTVRALAVHSPELRRELRAVVEATTQRRSFERPLYSAAVRCLSEHAEPSLPPLLAQALGEDDAGGLASLTAACLSRDAALSEPLSRAALSRHPVLAFAAELARLARGEAGGARVLALAPKIKEAHRIALCGELFVPLLAARPLPLEIAPALTVLRDAERHLGRWLLLGEVAARAGDKKPLLDARARAAAGPDSARAAWGFVAWALDAQAAAPRTRPTYELMARLSDRPSAERDATFLFRLAAAHVQSARPLLETLARGSGAQEDTSVRAALHLCRDYGDESQAVVLGRLGKAPHKDALRGLAAAALFDCGQRAEAERAAEQLEGSRQLSALGWTALLRAAKPGTGSEPLVSERNFRRIQQGACE